MGLLGLGPISMASSCQIVYDNCHNGSHDGSVNIVTLRTLRLYGGFFDDYFTIHLLPVATIFYDGRRVRRSASISEFYRIEFPKVITSHSSSFLLTANLLTTTSLA